MATVRGQGQRMSKEAIDYQAVLDDLLRRRDDMTAQFDAAIAGIRQVMSLNGIGQLSLPSVASRPVTAAAKGTTFEGLSVVDASIKFLRLIGRPQPHPRISEALALGGFRNKSKNFNNTLNSILWRRARTVGDVRKTKQGWGLTEWKQQQSAATSPKDLVADHSPDTHA